MAQDYLNIIGNWDSMAQKGRQRANAAVETKMKTLELQSKNQELREKSEAAVQQRIENLSLQAEAYAKLYRPDDLKKMKIVEEEAKARLKEQLNMHGDDITSFMRAGGREFVNEYRDTVLDSDEAQIIRNNHESLLKYMDQSDEDATLISDRDVENYNRWKTGELDSFIWSGAYDKLDEPSEDEIKKAGTLAEAYLHKNYEKVLNNYLIDTGEEFGADGRSVQEYYQDLLVYQNSKLGPADLEAAQDKISDISAGKRSASSSLQSIFDSINGSYQGNFDGFWHDPVNNKALKNLEEVAWINPYDYEEGGRNKDLYGQRMFVGQELQIAKEFFPEMQNGIVTFEDLENHQSNLGAGGVYDEDGTLIAPNESNNNDWGFWNRNDDWNVQGIELMFEVRLEDGTTKLMSKDDLDEDPEIRDRQKKAVMCMSLREGDGWGADDFRYMKLDLNSQRVSQKIDKVLGKIAFDSKNSIRETEPTYSYKQGETFKWIPENVNGLVASLDPHVSKVFSKNNFTEYDINASSVLMATAMMNNANENPYLVLQELASTKEPQELALINALKEGRYDEYYDLLTSYGATEKELRELADSAGRIKMGYMLYGDRKTLEI